MISRSLSFNGHPYVIYALKCHISSNPALAKKLLAETSGQPLGQLQAMKLCQSGVEGFLSPFPNRGNHQFSRVVFSLPRDIPLVQGI